MTKVKLSVDRGKDIFLHRTKIENLFISEYLPDAPGDYVKVFLFGLMYAQYELAPDRSELAKLLKLSTEEIAEAWIYWESRGLVRIIREKDSNNEEVNHIIFLSKIEELYGKPEYKLVFEWMDEIPPDENGKMRCFICRV